MVIIAADSEQSSVGILGSCSIQSVINCFSEFSLRKDTEHILKKVKKMDLMQEIGAHMTFWDLSGLSASENLVQRCNASSWLVSIIPSHKSE